MRHPSSVSSTLRDQLPWLVIAMLFVGVIITSQLDDDIAVLVATLGIVVTCMGILINWRTRNRLQTAMSTAQYEAQRFSDSQERTNTVYQLASTISSTLDHYQVLEAVQGFGHIALREPDPDMRLSSAVFLFRNTDNLLHVATAQRLTLIDMNKSTAGQAGILRQALADGIPTFGQNASADPELSYYVGFQNMMSVVAVPLRAGYQTYGVLVFGAPLADAFDENTADLLSALGTQATVALQNAALYQNLLDEKERIVQAEENARKKLSRDLHDGPTQTVSAIAMRVGAIQGLIRSGDGRKAHEELAKVYELANKTTKQIRHMLFALRPLMLESQGLIAALNEMSKKNKETYQLNVVVEADPAADRWLDDEAQGAIFYLIEEAINNARKHAQAEQITVRLTRDSKHANIEIVDNGVGFDVKAVDDSYARRGSLGMTSMRERAEIAGGTLSVKSKLNYGTQIVVRIPLPLELQTGQTAPVKPIVNTSASPTQNNEIPLRETRFSPYVPDTTLDES